MTQVIAVRGDITTQRVDAIVNAANNAMRGGGGVDGAIHRAGGPDVLADCIKRFPHGLATGDAGWTTAGRMPARWVIHTVGPNYAAGQRDRSLLESCYRRSLEIADELGARSVAFPLISAGIYGWPLDDAIAVAAGTVAEATTGVREVRIVVRDGDLLERVAAELARATPLRILQGVRELHRRGHHRVRVLPGMSASGMFWRVSITADPSTRDDSDDGVLRYTTGAGAEFAEADVTATTTPDEVAELILRALPDARLTADDPGYVAWFDELMRLVERTGQLPIAYADYFDPAAGWEVGWGSGTRHPGPPGP